MLKAMDVVGNLLTQLLIMFTKFISFEKISKNEIDRIFKKKEIAFYGFYGFLIPTDMTHILGMASVTSLQVFDLIESEILFEEIGFEFFNHAVKKIGGKYTTWGAIHFNSAY